MTFISVLYLLLVTRRIKFSEWSTRSTGLGCWPPLPPPSPPLSPHQRRPSHTGFPAISPAVQTHLCLTLRFLSASSVLPLCIPMVHSVALLTCLLESETLCDNPTLKRPPLSFTIPVPWFGVLSSSQQWLSLYRFLFVINYFYISILAT